MKQNKLNVHQLEQVLQFGKYVGHTIYYVCIVDFNYIATLLHNQPNFCINFEKKERKIIGRYLHEQNTKKQFEDYLPIIDANRKRLGQYSYSLDELMKKIPMNLN